MTMAQTYTRPPMVASRRSGTGSLFAMALPDGIPRELNVTAEVIWEVACSGSDRVVGEVAEVFDLPPEEIADAVQRCLESLTEQGLLEVAP